MFIELLGNPFGAASAFLSYNQGPELTISAAWMFMSVPCAHFYDDLLSLGLNLERGSGRHALRLIAMEQGTVLDSDKHSALHPEFVFVGSRANAWNLFDL